MDAPPAHAPSPAPASSSAPDDGFTIRPIREEEFDAFYEMVIASFHQADAEPWREIERAVIEYDRTLAVFDADRVVGATAVFTRTMTLPGGPVPVACVTWVGVTPTHTRRGLLTRLMRRQLEDLHEGGREPVAALWASEPVIYPRFGYGLASRYARMTCRTREVRMRRDAIAPDRRIRLGAPTDPAVRADLAAVHDRVRAERIGFVDRRDSWWDYVLHDVPGDRAGNTPLRVAVHDGPDGPDGYALYAVKSEWGDTGPDGEITLRELQAETPTAYASLWSFLLGLDLTGRLRARYAADEPLDLLVEDVRKLRTTVVDSLWVRLVDLPRALTTRSWAAEVDLVLDVDDAFCPWNTGRWRLAAGPAGATCERTDAPADLALRAVDLGSAHLGGTSLQTMADAGRVTELRKGALAAACAAYAVPRAPFCPEVF